MNMQYSPKHPKTKPLSTFRRTKLGPTDPPPPPPHITTTIITHPGIPFQPTVHGQSLACFAFAMHF